MSQHDELYPADLHRLKAAAIRESHRLRDEALQGAPSALSRMVLRGAMRLREVFRAERRESAARPGG